MSYDLGFRVPKGRGPISSKDFLKYFKGRPNYEINEGQAFYTNEDTGVYFSFEQGEGEENGDAGVLFNMNYFRPHVFGLEAEPELAAFVKQFQLTVNDPQVDGMDQGPYSARGFLKGWNAGNQFACKSIGKDGKPPTLPTSEIERIWRWNAGKEKLQLKMGEDVFVSKIMLLNHQGKAKTFVVWPDGIPIAMPDTELVVLMRDELAPKKLKKAAEPEHTVLPRTALAPVMRLSKRVDQPLPHTLFRYTDRPGEIAAFFKGLKADAGELEGLSNDTVLNQELLPG